MMNILSISTDVNILEDGSAVRKRMIEYGSLVDGLHIIVFSKRKSQETSNKEQTNSKFKIQNSNITVYPTNSKNKWMYVFDAIRIGKYVIQNSKLKTQNSLITCQDPFETGLVGWRLSRAFKLPLHIQVHADILSPYFKQTTLDTARLFLAPRILKRANAIRVVSKRIRRSLVDAYRIPASRINTLPIFVDSQEIEQAPVNTPLYDAFPQFKNTILMVSRLAEEKNIEMGIRAFTKVARRFPDSGLIIVGSGPKREQLEQLVVDLSLEDNVHFEGERADVVSFYKTATVFLHTSDFEGYGMVLAEAASAGCPIVTTKVGLVGDILTADNVFVCAPRDEKCIARQLGLALENKSAREHLAATAKRAVKEHTFRSRQAFLESYKKDWERAMR